MLPEGIIFLRLLMLNPPVRDINYFAYSGQILIFFFFGGGVEGCWFAMLVLLC